MLFQMLPIALWAAVSGTMFTIAGAALLDEREAITRWARQQEGNFALAVYNRAWTAALLGDSGSTAFIPRASHA